MGVPTSLGLSSLHRRENAASAFTLGVKKSDTDIKSLFSYLHLLFCQLYRSIPP